MRDPLPRLPQFEYIQLDSIEETLAFLKDKQEEARPFLGGTDLFVVMRDRRIHPKFLVDLKHLAGFNGLNFDNEKGLTVGAAVNLNQLISAKEVQTHYPVLAQSAQEVGGYQLRSRATLVGNLCNASPCGDTIGPSLVYDGSANVIGPSGGRIIPLDEFFRGPGQTSLDPGEIVKSLTFPKPPKGSVGTYLSIGRNKLSDLAMAAVTVLAYPDEKSNSGFQFKIALTAVAPTVIFVPEAQKLLADKPIKENTLIEAAQIAKQTCKPIDDIRSSKAYRQDMIYALTLRGLHDVWKTLGA